MPANYSIDDPRPIAAGAPYTFYLPSSERLAALAVGDLVKLIIRGVPPGEEYDAERMWVTITSIIDDEMVGELANEPLDIPQLSPGDKIKFHRWNIVDAELEGEDRNSIGLYPRREFWDRCLVDRCVIDDGVRVGYLYREAPDMAEPDDKYPDSGWRLRGEVVDPDEDLDERKFDYLALGAVLNKDDCWLHLIGSPIGSAYLWNAQTQDYEPCAR